MLAKFQTLWLNAQELGKVLNGLNTWQSEIFTEFPLKDSLKLLHGLSCFFRNVDRFQKLCLLASWRNIRVWAYYKIGMCLTLWKFTLSLAVKDIYQTARKSFFQLDEKMRCFFRIAKRFWKLMWICSGRIAQACAYHKIARVFIRLPDSVSKRLNARQSKLFTEFPQKASFDVC